jgi:multidrug efflux system membrane fusion protein
MAPIDGRTGALMAHVGDLVRANDTNPLVIINQLSPIRVTFSVPGRYISDIRQYQSRSPLRVEARIPTAVMPGAPAPASSAPAPAQAPVAGQVAGAPPTEEGNVSFIDNTVDPTTGTIKMKATFRNADRRLWPGLFVQVKLLLTTQSNAITVPSAAIQTTQDGQYVYVVKPDQTVDFRQVTVERQQGSETVIARGLQPGETVVTDGQLRLTPGARITTRRDELPQGGGAGQGGGRQGRGREGGGRSGGNKSGL